MDEVFENRNMAHVVFRHANLQGAVFDDVNLNAALITNANLKDFVIEDANIEGMIIFGVRIDLLLEAEFDRRDPERVRLRMSDPDNPASVRKVFERLDEVRAEFRRLLRALDITRLTTRRSQGRWSVIELVRHLVFAEDLYINRWVYRNDKPWIELGLVPASLANDPKCASVGSEPTNDLEAVLSAWEEVHAHTRQFVAEATPAKLRQVTSDIDFGQGSVGRVLQGLAQHDLTHIRQAEALIAEFKVEQAAVNVSAQV